MSDNCLTTQQVALFRARKLSPEEILILDEHIAGCTDCRRLLAFANPDIPPDPISTVISGSPSNAVKHPSVKTLSRYIDDKLPRADRDDLQHHVEICSFCSSRIENLACLRERPTSVRSLRPAFAMFALVAVLAVVGVRTFSKHSPGPMAPPTSTHQFAGNLPSKANEQSIVQRPQVQSVAGAAGIKVASQPAATYDAHISDRSSLATPPSVSPKKQPKPVMMASSGRMTPPNNLTDQLIGAPHFSPYPVGAATEINGASTNEPGSMPSHQASAHGSSASSASTFASPQMNALPVPENAPAVMAPATAAGAAESGGPQYAVTPSRPPSLPEAGAVIAGNLQLPETRGGAKSVGGRIDNDALGVPVTNGDVRRIPGLAAHGATIITSGPNSIAGAAGQAKSLQTQAGVISVKEQRAKAPSDVRRIYALQSDNSLILPLNGPGAAGQVTIRTDGTWVQTTDGKGRDDITFAIATLVKHTNGSVTQNAWSSYRGQYSDHGGIDDQEVKSGNLDTITLEPGETATTVIALYSDSNGLWIVGSLAGLTGTQSFSNAVNPDSETLLRGGTAAANAIDSSLIKANPDHYAGAVEVDSWNNGGKLGWSYRVLDGAIDRGQNPTPGIYRIDMHKHHAEYWFFLAVDY